MKRAAVLKTSSNFFKHRNPITSFPSEKCRIISCNVELEFNRVGPQDLMYRMDEKHEKKPEDIFLQYIS